MEWSKGVADAISTCKLQKTPLLVLVEPPASIVFNTDATDESPQDLYARVATNSLHDRLFEHDDVLSLIQRAGLLCVRLTADQSDQDYVSFSTFFKLDPPPPNLFLISPQTGSILFQKRGYVSPVSFATQLARVVKLVSNQTLPIPPALQPKQKRHNPFDHVDFASGGDGATTTTTTTLDPQQAVVLTATEARMPSRGDAVINGTTSSSSTTAAAAQLQDTHINRNSNIINNNSMNNNNNNNAMKLPQEGGQARLRARLPDGRQIEKRFIDTSPFHTVRTWLAAETGQAETSLLISLQFPRRVLTAFDDPKRLIELDLTPSASLIVLFGPGSSPSPSSNAGGASLSSSTTSAAGSGASAGMGATSSGWRAVNVATSAFGFVSSFVRSFVNPEPSGLVVGTAGGGSSGGDNDSQQRGQRMGSVNDRRHTQHWQAEQRSNIAHSNSTAAATTSASPAALQMSTTTPGQPPNANLRRRRGDNRNANGDNGSEDDDDRQWFSNGNSTQFGWNPSDVDKDRNEQE